MKQLLAQSASSMLTKMAKFHVKTMSAFWVHMPEPPKELFTEKED